MSNEQVWLGMAAVMIAILLIIIIELLVML